jgi:putative serine protease PepD
MVSGKASHALLGALVSDYSADGSKSGGFSTGALVSKLSPGGAGEKAGLKVGDVVIRFNGQAISSSSDLTAAVRFEKAGAMVQLVALRDGKEVTIDVTLGDLAAAK